MTQKITNEEMGAISSWLEQRTNATCPFCGAVDWTIDDELGTLPALQREEPFAQLDRGYAFVLVMCNGCGFTAHFAAEKMREAQAR